MDLVSYAEEELKRAGLFDEDSDYDGMLGTAAISLVRLFAEQGHSGCSAALTTQIVTRLMRYRPLTPITQPVEGDYMEAHMDDSTFQHLRCFSLFSRDRGAHWYDIDAPERCWWKPWTWLRRKYVKFPYYPK